MAELEIAFRLSMRALTSAVSIISTAYEGLHFGMTATAVTSVSMAPPSLLVCVNKTASLHDPLVGSKRFYINILHAYQSDLAEAFSARPLENRFAHGKWASGFCGLRYLTEAQANILCDLDQSHSYGGHTIIIGKVRMVSVSEAVNPLIYQNGKYTSCTSGVVPVSAGRVEGRVKRNEGHAPKE
jgi:flavin reductase (DIM6/NTAB) family NADH-FMN oxidoreductase RutF